MMQKGSGEKRKWEEMRIKSAYPTYEELKKCMPKETAEDTEYIYLFAVDDKCYYLGKKECRYII